MGEGLVHHLAVAAHHLRAALAVGLLDRLLDVRDRLLARQDAGDAEEAGLHDGVDAAAHPHLLGQRVGVDREEADLLLDHLLLQLAGQAIPDRVRGAGRVQQEDRARSGVLEHVDLVHELELMAGHEARAVHQVGGADGARARAQVRDRDRAGLLGVVDEVALDVAVGLLADDLDRVLVGADGAVRAEAVEERGGDVLALGAERRVPGQRGVGHVVDDPDGEVARGGVFWSSSSKTAFTIAGVNSFDESP